MGTSDMPGFQTAAEFERELWKLQTGDHLCTLFSSDDEYLSLLSAFIRQGLERRERVLAVVRTLSREQVIDRLGDQGVEAGFYCDERQLSLREAAHHEPDGRGAAEPLSDMISRETEAAVRDGYAALRIALEPQGPGHIARREAALDAFLPGSRCLALCAYDRRRFDAAALLEALESHPLSILEAEIFENFYYLAPLRGGAQTADAASTLDQRLRQLREHRSSEKQIRTLTRKLMKSHEDERRMISRELHDRVGQDLSSVRIGLETLLDRPLPPGELQAKISQLSSQLDRSILAVRDLGYDLRPPGLEIGIVQAVSMLCSEFSERTRLRVDFVAAGMDKLKLSFDAQINLYRMVQEALNNIQKHARASRAVVKLTAAHPHLLLRIEDDGCGFDMEKRVREMDSEKRMGLRSLQERADLLGGVMIVNSRVGLGTRILIKMPCREP